MCLLPARFPPACRRSLPWMRPPTRLFLPLPPAAPLPCRHSPAPFVFCVQLMVPCVPPISLVASWAAPMPVVGKSAEALIAEYEQMQGPAPDSVRAFFHALTG